MATNNSINQSEALPVPVTVAKGGTGLTTLTTNSYYKGNGTSAPTARTYAEVRTDLNVADGATANTKASGAEIDTGTDDAKFATAKAINDSHNVPSVAPSTSGNVMTSNGTDWVSSAPSGGATKEFFVPVMSSWTGSAYQMLYQVDSGMGNYISTLINASGWVQFIFFIPADFTSITSMTVAMIPDATETIQWDTNFSYAALGESPTLNESNDANRTVAVTSAKLTEVNINQGNIATATASLAAGDWVAVKFESDTADLRILGLRFKYA